MVKLKGVCIGAGYFSQFHFDAWNRIKEVEIIGICDLDKQRAERASQQFHLGKVYSSAEKMFAELRPDFVDIITPPDNHLPLVSLSIEYGVHIICQKPLAISFTEALEMACLVNHSGLRLMVHENWRFQPWYQEIKKILGSGKLGNTLHTINFRMRTGDGWRQDAYRCRQPYFREMKRFLVYETGIHFIDTFRFLAGEVTKVYSVLKRLNPKIKGEDFAWVQFHFAKGGIGFLDANRYNEGNAMNPRLTFGELLLETSKGNIRLYNNGALTLQCLGEKEEKYRYAFSDRGFMGDCVYATQKHFSDALVSGANFKTDINAYLHNLCVLEAIYNSVEEKSPVVVDYSALHKIKVFQKTANK